MTKRIYLLLAIVGTVLPYAFLLSFFREYGFDLGRFIDFLFANAIATFFVVDLVISSLVFWVFLYQETRKYQIREWWLCILGNLVVGLSLALPLFLYFREDYLVCEQAGEVNQ